VENIYETSRSVAEYLLFHYGSREEILPHPEGPASALDFAVRTAAALLGGAPRSGALRALDIGCAVGRSSFELSAHCAEVVGIDYSHAFIRAAESLRADDVLRYDRADEGDLVTPLVARRPAHARPDRVRFEQGDAMELRPGLDGFDLVHAANLIDRLSDPARFLDRLPSLLCPGGHLLLTSPYTWLETFTPRARWLGGFVRDGNPVRTLDALRAALEPHFVLEARQDFPFLIREHARKFQWSVAEGTLWRRRQA